MLFGTARTRPRPRPLPVVITPATKGLPEAMGFRNHFSPFGKYPSTSLWEPG